MSVFQSLLPIETTPRPQKRELEPDLEIVTGYCMKIAKALKFIQSDYAYRRYFKIDTAQKLLTIMKEKNEGVSEEDDLDQLRWVDSSLTDKLKPGYGHVFHSTADLGDKLVSVKGFHHPVVLGFKDGEILFLWLESEALHSDVVTALEFIM